MLYYFLLYNNVNQLYVYTCPLPLEPPSRTLVPLLWVITEHRAELPVLYSSFPIAIYFTHNTHMPVLLSQFIPFPFLSHVHPSFRYVCTSILALKIGSFLLLFLDSTNMCGIKMSLECFRFSIILVSYLLDLLCCLIKI